MHDPHSVLRRIAAPPRRLDGQNRPPPCQRLTAGPLALRGRPKRKGSRGRSYPVQDAVGGFLVRKLTHWLLGVSFFSPPNCLFSPPNIWWGELPETVGRIARALVSSRVPWSLRTTTAAMPATPAWPASGVDTTPTRPVLAAARASSERCARRLVCPASLKRFAPRRWKNSCARLLERPPDFLFHSLTLHPPI